MGHPLALLVLSSIPSVEAADITGDGIDDLVVGALYEGFGTIEYVGGIEVIRGSSSGLTTIGDAFFHQDITGVPGTNEDNDYFGLALGAGDVDGDGLDDLIVGGPGELVGSSDWAGAVWRMELTATLTGLSIANSQQVSQGTSGVTGAHESGDLFGWAVAVADFDGDGYDDVVIGARYEAVGSIAEAGAINFLRGSATGLTTSGQLYYDQDQPNVGGTAEAGDRFGQALAAGDFDGDGYADLAIGVPGEDWSGTDEGAVQVMYGTSAGPGVVSPNDEVWSAGASSSIAGTLADGNDCGASLAVGDFDDDGYDDLAIGCGGHDVGLVADTGAVLVVYGSASGLADSELWSQNSPDVYGVADGEDFGNALSSGDYNGDGYADLAIGAWIDNYASLTAVGVVNVIVGSASGLTGVGGSLLSQDTSSIEGTPVNFDRFGASLTSGDYDDDGYDDLVVGSPDDDEGGPSGSGVVNVFYGSASGPSTSGDQLFHQDTSGINDAREEDDQFGFTLR